MWHLDVVGEAVVESQNGAVESGCAPVWLPYTLSPFLTSHLESCCIHICNHTFPVYLISTSLYPRRTADMHTYIEKQRFSPLTTLPLSLGS